MPFRSALIGAAIVAATVSVLAQTPALQPAFEVASVRPNNSAGQDGGIMLEGRQFRATNAALRNLVATAYRTPWFRLVGSQPVLNERFDIVAKVPDGPVANDDVSGMQQRLLAERFALRVHMESREQPIYALVVEAKKLGPRLKVSPVDCMASLRQTGVITAPCAQMQMSAGRYVATGIPLDVLANILSPQNDRVVVDRTGLTGFYDVDLSWNPDAGTNRSQNSDLPSIFTAVQEQLGLKLQATTGPVDVLVVDHVERPTED